MMHMQELWRGRFADQALLTLVDDIDRVAETGSGYTEADHAAVAISVPPRGLCGCDMDADQRAVLRRVIGLYTGRAPAALAPELVATYTADAVLDRTFFAWAGSARAGEPHYYRVQGPALLVEYDNTQRRANHAHSVWRDLGADFGRDVLAEHRRDSPHEQR